MDNIRMCVLEDGKICDDCGECDRCDLDPNKICDNCCRCIAMEDEGKEFRSRTIDRNGALKTAAPIPSVRKQKESSEPMSFETDEASEEPTELTPELVEYWEKKLLEYGEAPADDGFGEIDVSYKTPVYGRRQRTPRPKR